jgi:hypothetical protein
MPERLDSLIDRLERTAAQLRAGELSAERAAALVDECARLAADASVELDRAVRATDASAELDRAVRAREGGPGSAGQMALES